MRGFPKKWKATMAVILALWIGIAGLYNLLKPIPKVCVTTPVAATFIPISSMEGASSVKYGLYLFHEELETTDFKEHLKQLSGVPVLFIPGNAGSYKQVRSLAAGSNRAYQGGPLERSFYQEASLTSEEGGPDIDASGFQLPNQYTGRLDWFAVDLGGEHSAMDGQILEEHAEYVVYAIHRILDQYRESHEAREREGAATSGSLPKSVILVGHSMGGFVARAATVHPRLSKSAVETVLTFSSPHQSPPLALQPSLGYYFARVNDEWRKGYEVHTTLTGHRVSDTKLSHVVVVSFSGGYYDYQVQSKLESLDGIVPPTNGFMISSAGMKNVCLSVDHQVILSCDPLVDQVSHTLLSMIDSRTGQPFLDNHKRLAMFSRMLRSGTPQSFNWMLQSHVFHQSTPVSNEDLKDAAGCPGSVQWSIDGHERDLYIQTTIVTVFAMDGRRRWLDIQKLGANGKNHFVFVSNLDPCTGVRLHLWPGKGKSTSDLPANKRILEVTSKMVHIPSQAAPKQVPPSAVLQLGPKDMHGFRFLTISTISGRPPPVASMAVGQFFNPKEEVQEFSPQSMLLSTYLPKEMFLKEGHPLAFNLSFAISLGLLPAMLTLRTATCGIKNSGLPDEFAGDIKNSRLCKNRCFPPVALAWEPTLGLHVFLNLYSETIAVDSSPALWSYAQRSEKTTVLLLADPRCSYKTSISVSFTAAASRFLLLYNPLITGMSVAVVCFAMRQASAWDLDSPMPSVLTAVESNLGMPFPFLLLAIPPILISLFFSLLTSQPFPPIMSFTVVSVICYAIANGCMVLLVLVTQFVFYIAANRHMSINARWQAWKGYICFTFLLCLVNLASSFFSLKVVRIIRANRLLVTTLVAIILAFFVHPALGLFVVLVSHALCCHTLLCSFMTTSSRSRLSFPLENNSPASPFGHTQLESFHRRHGLLILHLLACLMFVPSLIAWLQSIGTGYNIPHFLDSIPCIGVILHGIIISRHDFNSLVSLPVILGQELRLNSIYLVAGYCFFLSGLALAPYRGFYAMAAIGFLSFALWILRPGNVKKGELRSGSKKHS